MRRPSQALSDLRDSYRFLPPVVREGILDFARRSDLAEEKPDRIFEHFATYHVLNSAGLDEFDVSQALVGGENDTQLDAVAITINGEAVASEGHVAACLNAAIDGAPFVARFLFAQATMSAKFPSDKVALYASGILNFFLPETKLRQSPALVRTRGLKDAVLAALDALGLPGPSLDVFVVWPGTWTTQGHSEHATGVAEASLDMLLRTELVSSVAFHRIDSTRLQALIVDDAVAISGEIELTGLVDLPATPGVSFACIGFVRAIDYLSCLVGGDPLAPAAHLRDNVFHGNVRAFLGPDERVNRYIRESIVGPESTAQAEFALRNNGVTIIAEAAVRCEGANRLALQNFQVVNGCQTSHVLFQARRHLTPALLLPIKITATKDATIAQNIILGLNRQTEIDELQILARNDFVRRMQRHFDVISAPRPLWIDGIRSPMILFERRTGEFRMIADADRARVVTMQEIMQAFAAAFLESPHAVHEGGKGYLIRQVPKRMFADDHDVGFYFAAALLLWRARQVIGTRKAWDAYPGKHQMVFALRTLADPRHGCPPGRRDGEAHDYLRNLRTTLLDDRQALDLARQALMVVQDAARRYAASLALRPHGEEPDLAHFEHVRPTGRMAQREAFSDHVLTLCLAARAGGHAPPK